MPRPKGIKPVAQNRKAYHDFFVEETYECGLSLQGTEVKSIRDGRVNLKESFCMSCDSIIQRTKEILVTLYRQKDICYDNAK